MPHYSSLAVEEHGRIRGYTESLKPDELLVAIIDDGSLRTATSDQSEMATLRERGDFITYTEFAVHKDKLPECAFQGKEASVYFSREREAMAALGERTAEPALTL